MNLLIQIPISFNRQLHTGKTQYTLTQNSGNNTTKEFGWQTTKCTFLIFKHNYSSNHSITEINTSDWLWSIGLKASCGTSNLLEVILHVEKPSCEGEWAFWELLTSPNMNPIQTFTSTPRTFAYDHMTDIKVTTSNQYLSFWMPGIRANFWNLFRESK